MLRILSWKKLTSLKNALPETVEHVHSSPLIRCHKLASYLFPDHSISLEPSLMELACGEWEGIHWDAIPPEVIDKTLSMLEQLEILHLQNKPLGVLSQGERKKVLLARAMMSNPKMLIMDELCSGLDLYEREKLLKGISGFADRDVQMIYVTHHIEEIVPLFTHVALIDQGHLASTGPKKEVLTAERLQQVYQIPIVVDWYQERPWIRVTN